MGTSIQKVIERHLALLREQGKSDKTLANHMSIFRAYISGMHLELHEDLPGDFENLVSAHVASLPASQRDTKSILRQWTSTFSRVKRSQGLPDQLPQALQHMMSVHGQTKTQLAGFLHISPATFGEWVNGYHLPSRRHHDKLNRLEQLWDLPTNALLGLVTRFNNHLAHRTHTDYPSLTAVPYALLADQVPSRVYLEFRDLLAHKTDTLLPEGIIRESRWSLRPQETYGRAVHERIIIGNNVCVTGEKYWKLITGYLGYLHHTQGYPIEKLSLGLMADASGFKDFLHFIIGRRGFVTNHIALQLQYAMALVHPRWGYITQESSYAPTQNVPQSDWANHCGKQHKLLSSYLTQLKKDTRIKQGRSVDEPIQLILSDPEPLRFLYLMESRLNNAKPARRFKQRYSLWGRDRLLLRMLITNPLRINHYSSMTYREDDTGHLRRNLSDEWIVRFDHWEFKNSAGAAQSAYSVCVDQWAAEIIDDYLEHFRPGLVGANESDYLFLSAERGRRLRKAACESSACMVTTLSGSIRKLSVRHIPEVCPVGMGAHSIRHIVATHLLKNGASIDQVASVLHDRANTVRQRYTHLTCGDGLHILATHGRKYR